MRFIQELFKYLIISRNIICITKSSPSVLFQQTSVILSDNYMKLSSVLWTKNALRFNRKTLVCVVTTELEL